MLLAFKLKNYRSFRDEQILHLVHGARERSTGMPHEDVVPALAVLGANASGKSNLLRGLELMFEMIRNSAAHPTESLPYQPFLLGNEDQEPTLFEVSVRLDGTRYDYGFTYDKSSITGEWLYSSPRGRQRTLFERDGSEGTWYFGDSLAGATQTMADATRPDALFLSTARLLFHKTLSPLQEQLGALVRGLNVDTLPVVMQQTLESLQGDRSRADRIARFLKRSDLGIKSLSVEQASWPEAVQEATRRFYEAMLPDAGADEIQAQLMLSTLQPKLTHVASDNREVSLPFAWESIGTRNLLALLGPILDQLHTGGVLVVDELDTSLHPRLVSEIVKVFVNPETNPKQAQLILSTHDVTVMMNISGYGALGRDELWLVEKDQHNGSSRLYSIWDFKPRKGEVFSRNYLLGHYGALPRVDDTNYGDLFRWDELDATDDEN